MAQAHVDSERVAGRSWTVRLDAVGRDVAAVKVDCSRPACAARQLPSAAEGRTYAGAHLTAHLRAAGGPRPEAACACRAEGCQAHAETGRNAPAPQCGGAVVLAVAVDPMGRWWRAWECCARCAAAHPTARVVASAQAPVPSAAVPPSVGGVGAPLFSAAGAPPVQGPGGGLPPQRTNGPKPRRLRRQGKVAQRLVPHDLRPVSLRDELIELGDAFRAYQKSGEPDLASLADLHERKAQAFTTWADATGDGSLRAEARRAEQAAATIRTQHAHRTGEGVPGGIERVLTSPNHWSYARKILAHVRDHAPVPGPEARLLTLLLTLRAARTGSGNVTGQDVNGWPLGDAGQVLQDLVDSGWIEIPSTVEDLLTSAPENPSAILVPSLVPGEGMVGPFGFGKVARTKLSGWAQKGVGDRKLRKKKTPAATRLLALACAAHSSADGSLGGDGDGLEAAELASLCAVEEGQLGAFVDQLVSFDWLAEAELSEGWVTGRLSERVLPFGCPVVEGADEAGGVNARNT
ncbi:hypothetical protein GCM10010329_31070 [Streptomyces spiroverticillatus]|uniref:Uncharacterized protein n=1 Tax=Streptomyces finlayi TaxID=67296 RepID=A0A918WWE4_9ACTN|nr:hypothetical protein [Streptomyces finlayi]GHA06291.1 hypothetical protein GCM10010329_31070 [Streptomyces spiroverticillatus]GHC89925.1 hypothetical protein GCM10010334_23480 [Streptomyces finlayi]